MAKRKSSVKKPATKTRSVKKPATKTRSVKKSATKTRSTKKVVLSIAGILSLLSLSGIAVITIKNARLLSDIIEMIKTNEDYRDVFNLIYDYSVKNRNIDPYKFIGVSYNEESSTIKKTCRNKWLETHPDKNRDIPADQANSRFDSVKLACDILRLPEKILQTDPVKSILREKVKKIFFLKVWPLIKHKK